MTLCKKFKAVFAFMMAVAMMFTFAVGVSASTDTANSVTVKINLQIADRTGEEVVAGELTNPAIEVTAETSESLYTVIQRAVAAEGNLLTTSYWKEVPIVAYNPETGSYDPTGEYAQALESLTFDGVFYENRGEYNDTYTSYTGTNWMWFYGAPSAMPALSTDYPTIYLSQATVADLANYGNEFTLSYEEETMTW